MEIKHTPGPWLLSTNPVETNDHAASIFGPYLNGGAPFICDVSRSPGSERALENAKLIAAAPDMYEIVKELYDWAQSTQRFGPIYPKIEAVMNKITT